VHTNTVWILSVFTAILHVCTFFFLTEVGNCSNEYISTTVRNGNGITPASPGIFASYTPSTFEGHQAKIETDQIGSWSTAEGYRGTSLIRNRHPVGPYNRTMPRVLGGS